MINATNNIRTIGRTLFAEIAHRGRQTVRTLGDIVGTSKSSAHRHLQAQEKRNQYPESAWWETEAGSSWMREMVFAALYTFGVECNVGADKLSGFFKFIRIDAHAGVSPSALRTQLDRMQELLPVFQELCESQVSSNKRTTVVTGDETFFGDIMILVLMDLSSGYLIVRLEARYLSRTTNAILQETSVAFFL